MKRTHIRVREMASESEHLIQCDTLNDDERDDLPQAVLSSLCDLGARDDWMTGTRRKSRVRSNVKGASQIQETQAKRRLQSKHISTS
jgi:hypothetical protein